MSQLASANDWDNPDAWLYIPKFGVKPSEVNFEGFRYPVFTHKANQALAENITFLIGTARKLIQIDFNEINELNQSFIEALDQLENPNAILAQRHRVAVLYKMFILDIEQVTSSRASPKKKLEAMASAASLVAMWATDGAAAAHKRLRDRNAINASAPRPNRRAIDHEEVLQDFHRLVFQGHTKREARGILVGRGNMGSQATIFRITNKK